MSESSLRLQTKKLREIEKVKPYKKELVGFKYIVLPKVYGGGSDTEVLCSCLNISHRDYVLDIGTGTGVVALKAKAMGAEYVLATDLSPQAVKNAKLNSRKLKLKIDVKRADVFKGIKGCFDIITFNPPFTDYPAKKKYQICFWDKGNGAIRDFFLGLKRHLKKSGYALICWSSFGKKSLLKELVKKYNLSLEFRGRKKGESGFVYYVYKLTPNK